MRIYIYKSEKSIDIVNIALESYEFIYLERIAALRKNALQVDKENQVEGDGHEQEYRSDHRETKGPAAEEL